MTPPPQDHDENGQSPTPGSWGEYRRLVLSSLETLHKDHEEFREKYVTQKHFDAMLKPIFRIVYTAVGIILAGFLGALTAFVYSGVSP